MQHPTGNSSNYSPVPDAWQRGKVRHCRSLDYPLTRSEKMERLLALFQEEVEKCDQEVRILLHENRRLRSEAENLPSLATGPTVKHGNSPISHSDERSCNHAEGGLHRWTSEVHDQPFVDTSANAEATGQANESQLLTIPTTAHSQKDDTSHAKGVPLQLDSGSVSEANNILAAKADFGKTDSAREAAASGGVSSRDVNLLAAYGSEECVEIQPQHSVEFNEQRFSQERHLKGAVIDALTQNWSGHWLRRRRSSQKKTHASRPWCSCSGNEQRKATIFPAEDLSTCCQNCHQIAAAKRCLCERHSRSALRARVSIQNHRYMMDVKLLWDSDLQDFGLEGQKSDDVSAFHSTQLLGCAAT